jgi:hypothetical protein
MTATSTVTYKTTPTSVTTDISATMDNQPLLSAHLSLEVTAEGFQYVTSADLSMEGAANTKTVKLVCKK